MAAAEVMARDYLRERMPNASPLSEPARFRPYPARPAATCRPSSATGAGGTCAGAWRPRTWSAPSAPGVQLLCRVTWQPGPRRERPALVIAHGLGGSSEASYQVSLGRAAHDAGWHVVRMNLRGAGPSEAVCARLYNAGLAEDVLAVARAVAAQVARLVLVGYSLGGNLVLLAGSRDAGGLPDEVAGVAAVCAPVDLAACADRFDAPANVGYRTHFMATLKGQYRARQRRLPELYAPGLERGLRSIWSTTRSSRRATAASPTPATTTRAPAAAPGSRSWPARRCCCGPTTTRSCRSGPCRAGPCPRTRSGRSSARAGTWASWDAAARRACSGPPTAS